ncbi:uncharacterized protein LOC135092476 [Scylla paramamosain]|uniref:uncharacterized protein LOC135092476 n=1 Tax=Scylla paramamosain TaxID=85552 RepID=UPI003083779B
MAGKVIWPATGECVTLLTQGPCPHGQWVKLEKTTFKPVCEPQPCTLGGERGRGRGGRGRGGRGRGGRGGALILGRGAGVMVDGKCHHPADLPPTIQCPRNEKAVTNEHGEVECDCQPGFVYYDADNTCYEPYTRGPCLPGYVIRVEDSNANGRARCFPNECPQEGMVLMNASCHALTDSHAATADSSCYRIGEVGPCDAGRIIVDSSLAVPICLTTHTIFSDVVLGCPRGSRRDLFGRCRTVFEAFMSNVPRFSTRRPGGSSVCPPGEFFAGGTCLRIIG